jgi:hypothetical protein
LDIERAGSKRAIGDLAGTGGRTVKERIKVSAAVLLLYQSFVLVVVEVKPQNR